MDALTLNEIADMCGGTLIGDGSVTVRRLSKDTRTLVPGDLYLALHGENHNGNAFASAAAAKRAAAALIDDPAVVEGLGIPAILVHDSLAALHRLAGTWRDRLALRVVGLTGSSGKTSTKEFAAAVLSVRYRVTKTGGNLNNHIGLPLSILAASMSDDAAVWELGMNHAGEIPPLARLARPDLAIITNIGVAHIENLGTREAIAEEKGAILNVLGPDGCAILPAEDEFVKVLAARTSARVVLTGIGAGEVTARDIRTTNEGNSSITLLAGGECVPALVPAPGLHMVRNALHAVAAGLEFGLSLEECAEGLATARLVGGRLARSVVRGVTVVDDTYNANPDSMEAALVTLRGLPGGGRRIAVLGRMGELGSYAEAGYRRVGRSAAAQADVLVAVGPETAPMSNSARAAGLGEVYDLKSPEAAADLLGRVAREGDIVLVKGSRAARMERVIEHFAN